MTKPSLTEPSQIWPKFLTTTKFQWGGCPQILIGGTLGKLVSWKYLLYNVSKPHKPFDKQSKQRCTRFAPHSQRRRQFKDKPPRYQTFFLHSFIAGMDTTSSIVEWAMALLLQKPEKMVKAQDELEEVLGNNKKVQESDISKSHYLQAIVKETFRLHPPAPFLVPRKAVTDVEICGFIVPKNAQLLINVWAMGRDLSIWPSPNLFMPERLLENGIEFKGQDFELIPFGAGRRICPGLPLANRMVHLMLASLVHNFAWKLPDEMKPEDLDLGEMFGLTLHKAEPLRAIPIISL
ncbi:hypothetical protein CMV_020826 [Castanea mollissima]|uniref:Cytochrome P450 n=1 Tax=Castanea mollissima TaxID=60419 RepID=A0A8J4QYA9_9ROSI|nr:hypothetical protein CMV_020826 [Castanea mollissima]